MGQWEMKVGERAGGQAMMEVPPWPSMDEFDVFSPQTMRELAFFTKQRYLPSNDPPPLDAYSCDEFRMFDFKVRRCGRGRSHDWTECPFAHPGEKARRRDPRKFRYSGAPCPDFRKGSCNKGDSCEHAHGVFESWLHPTRYRTQACKDGTACRRRVCFFAHTPEQLRPLPSYPKSRLEEAVMEEGRVSPDFGWVWELVK